MKQQLIKQMPKHDMKTEEEKKTERLLQERQSKADVWTYLSSHPPSLPAGTRTQYDWKVNGDFLPS